jgi:O-antigen/teichoic acid export membrane protein
MPDSIVRSSLVYLVGIVATRVCSLILLPIFTRNLDPAAFGTLELLNRATEVVLLCLFLNGNCLATIALYNQVRDPAGRRRVAATSLVFGGFCVALIGGVALGMTGPIASWLGVPSRGLLRLALLAAMADAWVVVGLAHAQARVEALAYSVITLAQVVLRVGLIAWLVCVLGLEIRGVLLASLLTSGLLAILLTVREVRRSGLEADWQTMSELARFALPFLPAGFCGLLLHTGDQFFLVRHVSLREIGLYALAYKVGMLPALFTRDPLMKVWGARMHTAASEPDAPRSFGRLFSRFVLLYLVAGLGLVVLCDELLRFMSSPRYAAAAVLVPPIVLAYLFGCATDFLDAAFYVRRRTATKLGVTGASTAVMLGLYLVLIPTRGPAGAAYATLAGMAVRAGMTYVVSQRLFPVAYDWPRIAGSVLVTVAPAACVPWLAGPPGWRLAAKLGLLAIWCVGLWVTNLIVPEDKLWVLQGLRRLYERAALALAIPLRHSRVSLTAKESV